MLCKISNESEKVFGTKGILCKFIECIIWIENLEISEFKIWFSILSILFLTKGVFDANSVIEFCSEISKWYDILESVNKMILIIKKDNIPPITNPPILSNNEDNPNVKIAVGGCVASQEGSSISRRAPFVDVIFGPQTLHKLPEMLDS